MGSYARRIPPYHGVQFTPNHAPKGRGKQNPAAFGQEITRHGTIHVLARTNHPQTNGKIERLFQAPESGPGHFQTVPDFIERYYQ